MGEVKRISLALSHNFLNKKKVQKMKGKRDKARR